MNIPWHTALQREFARSDTDWCIFKDDKIATAWAEQQLAQREKSGLTWASALLAETGTVVLCASDQPSRTDSLLVKHHIVLVTADKIFPDLASYLATLPQNDLHSLVGSHMTLITGPSRTADIEKVLVKPAHGPATLTIGIVDSC